MKYFCCGPEKRVPSSKPKIAVKMVTGKDDFFYKLDHKSRGMAVIFNHEQFLNGRLNRRHGTNKDEANLKVTLKGLGFTVHTFKDLSTLDLLHQVDKFSAMDHSESDCFIMCILTHGDDGWLYSNNSKYNYDDIFSRFTADQCKTLAGKPKLFFIQACQRNYGNSDGTVTDSAPGPANYGIPVFADFLIVYSAMPGHYSWGSTTGGCCWFIQALCDVLRSYSYVYDLLTLLTLVNYKVNINYESSGNREKDAQNQFPCITFMLTRVFKLPPFGSSPSGSK